LANREINSVWGKGVVGGENSECYGKKKHANGPAQVDKPEKNGKKGKVTVRLGCWGNGRENVGG